MDEIGVGIEQVGKQDVMRKLLAVVVCHGENSLTMWMRGAEKILAAFLARRWGASIGITRQIAEGAKGNVMAAMATISNSPFDAAMAPAINSSLPKFMLTLI
jgi:hypothetical protein